MGGNQSNQFEIAGEVYRKLRVLGKGAYGKVYAMEHVATKKIRVIKELHKGHVLAEGDWAIQANVDERKILTRLFKCPYVCKIYGANQDAKFLYVMLDFCHGGELAFHLSKRGRFSEEDCILYGAMLTSCYLSMHQMFRIIHRDIKPENVLLSKKGYLRVIDFNFAVKTEDTACTMPNTEKACAGTLPYIAPEILQCKPYDYTVDYYSMGVFLFELCTGRTPFGSFPNRKQMYRSVIKTTIRDQVEKARRKGVKISEDFGDLLCQLCEFNPKRRIKFTKIKSHPVFKDIDWTAAEKEKMDRVPFLPDPNAVNFVADSAAADALGLDKPFVVKVTEEDQGNFTGWNWLRADQGLPKSYDMKKKAKLDSKAQKIAGKRDKKIPVANRTANED